MIIWDDIEKFTKDYSSGLIKLDGLNENKKINKKKSDFNKK